jgi:hypothetical protein
MTKMTKPISSHFLSRGGEVDVEEDVADGTDGTDEADGADVADGTDGADVDTELGVSPI